MAHSMRTQSTTVGSAQGQECEAAGHIASPDWTQRGDGVGNRILRPAFSGSSSSGEALPLKGSITPLAGLLKSMPS